MKSTVTAKPKKKEDEATESFGNPPALIKRDAFGYVASGKTGPNVGCHSCYYYDEGDGECELFESLNDELPESFKLVEKVAPEAGCRAHVLKKKEKVS